TTVAAASTEALPVSVRRNVRSGVSIRRTQAVFPENRPPVVSSVTSTPSDSMAASAASKSAWSGSITPEAPDASDDSLIAVSPPAAVLQPPRVDDAPQETPCSLVRRLTEQLHGRCLFHDLPVGQETHPAGDVAGEPHLVRGDQHRHPAFGQFPDHVEHVRH